MHEKIAESINKTIEGTRKITDTNWIHRNNTDETKTLKTMDKISKWDHRLLEPESGGVDIIEREPDAGVGHHRAHHRLVLGDDAERQQHQAGLHPGRHEGPDHRLGHHLQEELSRFD